jgi:hypothetical protein
MKTLLSTIAVGAAVLLIPVAILAQGSPAMAPMKPAPTGATVLCRAAAPNEKANAALGTTSLVCKSMAPMMKGGMMMVPSTNSSADSVWMDWIQQSLNVPYSGDG